MSGEGKLKVVLCWHMHQPQYRDLIKGTYHLPWTYLHAIKDYTDMAAHLEAQPQAQAVFNFSPILLEQLDDYSQQLEGFLYDSQSIRDPLLAALADASHPIEPAARASLMKACLRANERRLIQRFPAFAQLAHMANLFVEHPDSLHYVRNQFLTDLVVWYHLAWMGETVRREDKRVKRLMEQDREFTLHDRRELLTVIHELVSGIIPRYRKLAEQGQIELSMSPYAHPIVPLLLDLNCAVEAMPTAPLPALRAYPDGEARARWHIEQAIRQFETHFGLRPKGCWPSEGSVSDATLKLLQDYGIQWIATGETVLRNSLNAAGRPISEEGYDLFQPNWVEDCEVAGFFRDDRLSDSIGFVYAEWHGDDAVADLIHHLETIADTCQGRDSVVSIILDGENAWEYYPENGYHFLSALYRRLVEHPRLQLTTFSDVVSLPREHHILPHLVPGSWVYGTFSTWIGEHDKNHGWDMLGEAKRAFDEAAPGLSPSGLKAAMQQLAVCEGSDWFWWFGGDNPSATVHEFDSLYRTHLSNLYQLIQRAPPDYLAHAFSHGGGAAALGGVMRPGKQA